MSQDFVIENNALIKYIGVDKHVVVPDEVTAIGDSAFEGCNKILSITLPENVVSIGARAFMRCTNLKTINLPNSVQHVGVAAFHTCYDLSELVFPETAKFDGYGNVITNCWNILKIVCPKSVGYLDLDGCNKLFVLACPGKKLEKIPKKHRVAAVRGYIHYTERFHNNSVNQTYNDYLFKQKKNLLPEVWKCDAVQILVVLAENGKITKKNIDDDFMNPAMEAEAKECVKFLLDWKNKNITPEDRNKMLKNALGEIDKDPYNATKMKKVWASKKLEDGTLVITSYKGNETAIEIPPRIGKSKVTKIGDVAFSPYKDEHRIYNKPRDRRLALEKIKSISIPEGITEIGIAAFSGCENLTTIDIPNTIVSIGAYAFHKCKGLADEQGLTIIRGTLYNCNTKQANIKIPNGVKTIGNDCFSDWSNSGQKTLIIPESVEEIEDWRISSWRDMITVYVQSGSYAEQYAKKNRIPYIIES